MSWLAGHLRYWDLSEDIHLILEILILRDLSSTRLWFVQSWSTPIVYEAHSIMCDKVKRVQRRFMRYAMIGLRWTCFYDLTPRTDALMTT
jgi:hypothetical protein